VPAALATSAASTESDLMNAPALAPVSENALAEELDAICASGAFRHSPQHQRLLRHLLAKLGAGDLASLREMTLGIEVFRRSPVEFDPKKDPIVRVEARRLRERLARYYALEGERSRVEIVVPVGSYVPIVRGRSAPMALASARPAHAQQLQERALYVLRLRTIDGYRKALELFSRATRESPDFAPAYRGIGWARICIAGYDGVPPEAAEQGEPMRVAVEAAAALDHDHPEVAALRASYAVRYEHDIAAAERLYRDGLSRSPDSIGCRTSYAWLNVLMGRFDDAQRLFESAYAEDPFGFWHRHNLGSLAYFRRDYAGAEKILRDALEIEPDHAMIRLVLARVLMHSGRGAEAVAETAWCVRALPGMTGAELFHVAALAGTGERRAAARAMRDFEGKSGGNSEERYTSPVYRAMAHAALEENDRALQWLARAAVQRDYWLLNIGIDPAFDRLRSRADFSAILRAVGLPELQFID
jgi:tetratricopeptide (TPR) repeat protein